MTADRGLVSVEVRGFNRVKNSLRRLLSKDAAIFDSTVYNWAQGVRLRLKIKPYPPKRPQQKYIRTGRLANSWRVQRIADSQMRILNSTRYAGYVVGDEQAWMHAGRWWKAREIIEEAMPELRRMVYDQVRDMGL